MGRIKERRIVRMSRLAKHGYEFSVKTCYEWVSLPVDPMPYLDMRAPGAAHAQYFIDLDELDIWLARRRRGGLLPESSTLRGSGFFRPIVG